MVAGVDAEARARVPQLGGPGQGQGPNRGDHEEVQGPRQHGTTN